MPQVYAEVMVLTLLSMLALALAFVYLLWSIGAQYPDRSMRSADRPEREERMLRRGPDVGSPPPARRPRRRRSQIAPDPGQPGVPTRVAVDRGLAQMMIEEAAAAGVGGRLMARAARDLARGDALVSAGRHDDAMRRYGRAWARASRALRGVG